jgi:pimeloyl-ACP methyl ester carboxylesterase
MRTMKINIARGNRNISVIQASPADTTKSAVIMLHGIFSEKTEDGRYNRLAAKLATAGLASWRFDFTGHGDDLLNSRDFSVAAALADFSIVAERHRLANPQVPCSVVASSFGGSIVLLAAAAGRLSELNFERYVLLNPVTNYINSFLEPFGAQMKDVFKPSVLEKIRSTGEAEIQPRFILSLPTLYEFKLLKPADGFSNLEASTLVLHGDRDTAVCHDTVRADSTSSDLVDFRTVRDATHAFTEPHAERLTFDLTTAFLTEGI